MRVLRFIATSSSFKDIEQRKKRSKNNTITRCVVSPAAGFSTLFFVRRGGAITRRGGVALAPPCPAIRVYSAPGNFPLFSFSAAGVAFFADGDPVNARRVSYPDREQGWPPLSPDIVFFGPFVDYRYSPQSSAFKKATLSEHAFAIPSPLRAIGCHIPKHHAQMTKISQVKGII